MSGYTKEDILELAEMWDLGVNGEDIVGFALELLYGSPNHYIERRSSMAEYQGNYVGDFEGVEPSPTIH